MTDCVPIFKTCYSLGKSILTLEKAGESIGTGPDSVVDIVLQNELTSVFLVEDNMSSLFTANQNLASPTVSLNFGLRLSICPDVNEKNDYSIAAESKIVIFAKTPLGRKLLIKIWDIAANQGFYYVPRIDSKSLRQIWDEEHLQLCIPFYDSHIYNNLLTTRICVPDLGFAKLIYFIEDNGLPFDYLIKNKIESLDYVQTLNVQSIFYKKRSDFNAYQTFKCINNRSSLEMPRFDHMCSDSFCFESWCEKTEREMV